jgi:molybdopterin-guanine dinucleotide biosynthesis protein A
MGSPKALVEVGGIALWRRQVDLVQSLGPSDLMISAGADWEPGLGPWTVVRDKVAGLGPLGGIQSALASMGTDLLLVLAVDMPAMSRAYLEKIVGLAGPKGVVPEDGGFFEGLASVYPRSIRGLVDEALDGQDRSLQALVGRASSADLVTPIAIEPANRVLFRNVNRAGDL